MKTYYQRIFIVVFLGMLIVPLRTLALAPNAIADSFYLRERLITWTTNLRLTIGDRVFPRVLAADDGWLVFIGEGDLDDYQKVELFTQSQLESFQARLDALADDYAKRGMTLIVIVPPNKNTIYPERVPSQIPIIGNESKLDQLTAHLKKNGNQQIIDLRPALRKAKAERQIYYATDTHWNDYGAYIAYSAILKELNKSHPNLAPRPISDFNVINREPHTLDLAKNISTTLLPEGWVQLAPNFSRSTLYKDISPGGRRLTLSYNPDDSLPNLVMYYDSFFFNVIPMLGEHFHRGVLIQNFMGGGLWNFSWVDEHQPDVVIIEFSERYLREMARFIESGR
jgi:alginate O-acetyltransferase complex protein AlgJ